MSPSGKLYSGRFNVLVVCTANLCRSPLAEYLLRDEVDPTGRDWRFSSVGVRAVDGRPMHPLASQVLAERGIDTERWRSRRLTEAVVHRADLVLTATTAHRGEVVRLVPQALGRTFTLIQFEAYTSADVLPPSANLRGTGPELLERVAIARGQMQPSRTHRWDLADPIDRPLRMFRQCADRLSAIADAVRKAL